MSETAHQMSATPDDTSPPATKPRIRADLRGVPETALWTLRHRASEAARRDTVLPDPRAVQLVADMDFPFRARLGPVRPWVAQAVALRALAFDGAVRSFLADHPQGTVVALGEGLETQFWRIDNGRVRWVSVDLGEPLKLRASLLPHGDRQRLVAGDVRDSRWTDSVDTAHAVLVTAQGLLMYLEHRHVSRLIAVCAHAFPGATMAFDTVSRRFSARTRAGGRGPGGHRLPPMPWGMDAADRDRLRAHTDVAELSDLPFPPGRGLLGHLAPRAASLPLLRHNRPLITRLRLRSE